MKLSAWFVAILALALGGPAQADPIVLDQWYTFGFNPTVGSSIFGNCGTCALGTDPTSILAPAGPWTFTIASSATLIVVDGFLSGDQFNLTNSGVSLGDTSVPPISGADCSSDITACLGNANFSQGMFALAPGSYSIAGTVVATEGDPGAAFFEVIPTAAVPLPGALPLFASALGGLGLLGWRRKRKQAVA